MQRRIIFSTESEVFLLNSIFFVNKFHQVNSILILIKMCVCDNKNLGNVLKLFGMELKI